MTLSGTGQPPQIEMLPGQVRCANDAHAAACGEYRAGAGEGRDMVFLTVSTGMGGG